MEWLNVFGLIFIVVIMIPNIIFAVRCKAGFENRWSNKAVEFIEQIVAELEAGTTANGSATFFLTFPSFPITIS